MDINQKITEELGVKKWQVDAAVKLIDEGNTIPFIARYRKEAHGTLDDEQLRKLYERLTYLRNLEEKKEQVLASIEEQGKLTPELKAQIVAAETQVLVDDLYRPYRPKRQTRATIAKEKGLESLAVLISLQNSKEPLEKEAEKYVSEEKGVKNVQEAIDGAKDILAENISDEADYRKRIRDLTFKKGTLVSAAKDEKAESVYEMYYDFTEAVSKVAGHRVLALNRGEKEKFLSVKIEAPEEEILRYLEKKVICRDNPYTTPVSDAAADRRTGCAWMGSCIPYRMQACCGRSDRKSNRHDCNLSDSAYDSEEDPGSKRSAEKDYSKVSHLFDFPGKWNSIQRIRTVYCRTVKRDSGKSAVCDRK